MASPVSLELREWMVILKCELNMPDASVTVSYIVPADNTTKQYFPKTKSAIMLHQKQDYSVYIDNLTAEYYRLHLSWLPICT